MSRLFALTLVVCSLHTVLGQGQGGFGPPGPDFACVTKCTSGRQQPMVDAQKDNSTTLCPQVGKNQTEIDADCAAFKQLQTCLGACADSPFKAMAMNALKSQQFICVDRFDDFKKNMPCLSNACPDMERSCQPKCGSLEEKSQKVINLMQQMQGNGPPLGFGPPGANVSPTPGKGADTSAIMKAFADVCTATSCYMTCGEPIMTKQCGKDAYLLYRDMTWNMSSSVAQGMMSSVGIQTQLPQECTAPKGTEAPTAAGGASTSVIPSIALLFATIFLAIRRA